MSDRRWTVWLDISNPHVARPVVTSGWDTSVRYRRRRAWLVRASDEETAVSAARRCAADEKADREMSR